MPSYKAPAASTPNHRKPPLRDAQNCEAAAIGFTLLPNNCVVKLFSYLDRFFTSQRTGGIQLRNVSLMVRWVMANERTSAEQKDEEQTLPVPAPDSLRMLPERQLIGAGQTIPWHDHRDGYAAIVLAGSYLEAGDGGRMIVEPGHVVVHPPFSGHADFVNRSRVEVVNLHLPMVAALTLRSGRTNNPEELIRAAASDPAAALTMLTDLAVPVSSRSDEVDLLAQALRRDGTLSITEWARSHGISERTVTRRFTAAYSMTPAHYRMRVRAQQAWKALVTGHDPLADVAAAHGFADQAHMTRAVRALTGMPPGPWRAQSRKLSD